MAKVCPGIARGAAADGADRRRLSGCSRGNPPGADRPPGAEARDIEALADAISALAADTPRVAPNGEAGRQLVGRHFADEIVAREDARPSIWARLAGKQQREK